MFEKIIETNFTVLNFKEFLATFLNVLPKQNKTCPLPCFPQKVFVAKTHEKFRFFIMIVCVCVLFEDFVTTNGEIIKKNEFLTSVDPWGFLFDPP